MNNQKEIYIGIAMVILFLIVGAIFGGLKFFGFVLALFLYGWLGIMLYEMKPRTWLQLLLIKIPLNLMFNFGLMFILLLKSWTMLSFREELKALETKKSKQPDV